ncbi:MAG: TerC/Alx family metal homeostasis membrane protein [Planctomycetota bacterium]|nr:TerC/Alx family metal homeostasis membrane protein [Planctomycetota bacterium]
MLNAVPDVDLSQPITSHVRTDFVCVGEGHTVEQALDNVRKRQIGGRIVYFYVLDDDGRLRGVVPTRRLLLSEPDRRISDLMIRNLVTVPTTATVRDACELFLKHRFLALPVVDGDGRMAGVLDVELYTKEAGDLHRHIELCGPVAADCGLHSGPHVLGPTLGRLRCSLLPPFSRSVGGRRTYDLSGFESAKMGSVSGWEWASFAAVVALFVGADLFAHRGNRPENRRRAVAWVVLTIIVGLGFGGYVWAKLGPQAAQEYLAAYLLEESLSLDDLFVFLIIFRMTQIPKAHQRVALSWGILGALVFRGIFIFLGIEVLHRWAWIEYVFALLLLYAAWHSLREDPGDSTEDNKLVAWLTRHLPVSRPQGEARFVVREAGRLKATPLLVAILALEASDLLFAIDSVPAAFSVTRNEFLIYSSNVFAILGLRSLYVVLAHTIAELRYLHYGLAAVLAFAGAKILAAKGDLTIEPLASVAVIVLLIGVAVVASLLANRRHPRDAAADTAIDLAADTKSR